MTPSPHPSPLFCIHSISSPHFRPSLPSFLPSAWKSKQLACSAASFSPEPTDSAGPNKHKSATSIHTNALLALWAHKHTHLHGYNNQFNGRKRVNSCIKSKQIRALLYFCYSQTCDQNKGKNLLVHAVINRCAWHQIKDKDQCVSCPPFKHYRTPGSGKGQEGLPQTCRPGPPSVPETLLTNIKSNNKPVSHTDKIVPFTFWFKGKLSQLANIRTASWIWNFIYLGLLPLHFNTRVHILQVGGGVGVVWQTWSVRSKGSLERYFHRLALFCSQDPEGIRPYMKDGSRTIKPTAGLQSSFLMAWSLVSSSYIFEKIKQNVTLKTSECFHSGYIHSLCYHHWHRRHTLLLMAEK